MDLVIDIETPQVQNSLLNSINKIYCIATKVDDEKTKCSTYYVTHYGDATFPYVKRLLKEADTIIGHNIVKFDIPIIERVLGIKIKAKIVDTLLDAKLAISKKELIEIDKAIPNFPSELIGSYSLKAFGYRLGLNKIEYEDFSMLSEEMVTYCKRDVDVTYALYNKLKKFKWYPSDEVREVEYKFASIIKDQQEYGFYFDYDKANKLAVDLKFKKITLEQTLKKVFPSTFVPDGPVVVPTKKSKRITYVYLDGGERRIVYRKLQDNTPLHSTFYTYIEGEYQKLKLQSLNPSSRKQLVERLISTYGWEPKNYTEKGAVKLELEDI